MRRTRALQLFAWLGRQALSAALVLLGTSLLLFLLTSAAPGDAATSVGTMAVENQDSSDSLRASLNLNKPWFVRYGSWVCDVATGDFGKSSALQRGRPVTAILLNAARRSMSLVFAGFVLSTLSALALALLRSLRPRSKVVGITVGFSQLVSTLPVFLCSYIMVTVGNRFIAWGAGAELWAFPAWFPFPSGIGDVLPAWTPWTLAAFILAVGDGALIDLYQAFLSELDHALKAEHLVGVKLLGMSMPMAAARGFLPGATAHLSRRIAFALGSLVVLESVLGWHGLGSLAWKAAIARDLPILLGVAIFFAAMVRFGSVAAAAVRYWADPRSRVVQ